MKKIIMSGEIGWDIMAFMVADELKGETGDIEVDLSSVGGSVFEGIEIFQLFGNYKRENPKAQMILNMGAIVASMGSYNAANKVFDMVTVQKNTSWMEHNPTTGTYGDYRDAKKMFNFLENLTIMMAPTYAEKSGNSIEVERKNLDDETWLFGQEIIEAGFADEMLKDIPEGQPVDRASAIAQSELKLKAVMKKVRETEMKESDFEKVAAIMKEPPPTPQTPATGGKNNTQEVTKMGDENKKPEIDAKEIEKAGYDRGITSEKERVTSLLEMKKKKDFEGITAIHDRIDEAIANGENVQDVHTFVNATSMKGGAFAAALDTNAVGDISQPASTTLSGEAGTAEEKKLIESNSTF